VIPSSGHNHSGDAVPASSLILDRFFRHRRHDDRLALSQPYFDMLAKLGDPHKKLPPVFHVAGTNGKGSTCAFLRAILEAAGHRVHVYTSPHLVRFHERIRLAGKLISEDELVDLLTECERIDEREQVSDFEAATAAAFAAFARHPADYIILETGLGGRLDATNVIDKPLATIITRLSYDHRDYLGDTIAQIAGEKAGIMRAHVPCFAASQPEGEAIAVLKKVAAELHAPLSMGGETWRVEKKDNGFHYADADHEYDFTLPGLTGDHQIENAGLAIAALSALPKPISQDAIQRGLKNVTWPARLHKLETGRLAEKLPKHWELWLDGGHNDSAGEALAAQAKAWGEEDDKRDLHIIMGMLKTKCPHEFLTPLAPYISDLHTITIPGEAMSFSGDDLVSQAQALGNFKIQSADTLQAALDDIFSASLKPGRILICGSLYLAGHVLHANGTVIS
jgi:dihydrofolate synthase/folylpolyglutamate synthase